MITKLANEAAAGNMLHADSIIIVTAARQPL